MFCMSSSGISSSSRSRWEFMSDVGLGGESLDWGGDEGGWDALVRLVLRFGGMVMEYIL